MQNCFKLGKELAPKAYVQVKFCSDPIRCEDYFPKWKPALTGAHVTQKKENILAIKLNNFAGRIEYLSYQVISNKIIKHFTVHLNDLRQYA